MPSHSLPSMCHSVFPCLRAEAQDPCGSVKRRALVLGGGGPKGAFQTGAVYHLAVHRNCDFHEFSGVSVGALNAAFLAQAAQKVDASDSHAELVAQSEGLVSLWGSITKARDVAKRRRLATLRFGLFGAEHLYDFRPLRRLMETNISLDKLAKGRPVRAGLISFWDGGYREVLAGPMLPKGSPGNFLDYLYASSVPPVYGRMPRIRESAQAEDPKLWMQLADGGVRHNNPVVSYFRICKMPVLSAGTAPTSTPDSKRGGACDPSSAFVAPVHEPVQQLFVIATNPYSRDSDLLPVTDPKCCRRGSRQITKGPKILGRTLELMANNSYRWDLDFLLLANDILRWCWQAYRNLVSNTPAERMAEAKRQFGGGTAFPVESYNRDPQDPDAPSLPYEIGLVIPEKQYAGLENLRAFSRPGIREQIYCGCRAADKMMQNDFGLPSLADKCTERFPPLQGTGKDSAQATPGKWDATVCQQTGRPMLSPSVQGRTECPGLGNLDTEVGN